MDLLRQQTPEAQFGFSLRFSNTSVGSLKNLKAVFEGPNSIVFLIEFLRYDFRHVIVRHVFIL